MRGMPCMLLPWGVFSQRRRQQQYWNEQRAPDGARWHLAPAFAAGIWRWHGSQAFGAGRLALVPALMGVLVLASAWSSLAQAWRPLQPRCRAAERGGAAVARAAEGSRFGRRLVQAFATPAACSAGWARLLLFSLLLSCSLSFQQTAHRSQSAQKGQAKKNPALPGFPRVLPHAAGHGGGTCRHRHAVSLHFFWRNLRSAAI